jgi:transcriptional regulator with XRE-family HTH domain
MASRGSAKNDEAGLERMSRQLALVLRRALERKGFTQGELARAMGTSRTVVHRLLNGSEYSVNLRTLARAAMALGVDLSIRLENAPDGRLRKAKTSQ